MPKVRLPTKYVRELAYGLLICLPIFSGYHFVYAQKIIPGVYIGEVYVGGKNFVDAKAEVTEYEQALAKNLQLVYGDNTFEFTQEELGLVYNTDAAVVRAFEIGRTGNLFLDTKDKLAGLIKPLKVNAFYDLRDDALSDLLSFVKGEVNESSDNAYFQYVDGELTVVPQKTGEKVDGQKLYDVVVASFDNMDFSAKKVEVVKVEPELSKEQLEVFLPQVEDMVKNGFFITFEDRTWEVTPEELVSFIAVSSGKLDINSPALEAYSARLAKEINKLPKGKVTEGEDGKVITFEFVSAGTALDEQKFTGDFKNTFLSGGTTVALSVTKVEGSEDPAKYGIHALLAEGTSSYKGSASARIHNLTLAAERTDGVLVPPGETYSFNNTVGEISAATGFATAYVISNGRTVLGDGGGVCQTSTTLFRAVLNAGLPVVTRHPHAYRVYYYEQDMPAGFDASVYQPGLDFRFQNDTANYILVTTSANTDESTLSFKLYGTPDGRQVELSEAILVNVVAPPEPLYQDDPTLEKGVTKQVDFSAWGGTASFDRTVTRGNEVLYEDTFTTRYQPWRAIYLVGTKD